MTAIRRQVLTRTHCYRGHEWTPENTITLKDARSKNGSRRQCRACKNETRRFWAKTTNYWVTKKRYKKKVNKCYTDNGDVSAEAVIQTQSHIASGVEKRSPS